LPYLCVRAERGVGWEGGIACGLRRSGILRRVTSFNSSPPAGLPSCGTGWGRAPRCRCGPISHLAQPSCCEYVSGDGSDTCRCPVPAQAGATGFYAVWDHWLLDTLSTWQKQTEESYAIRLDDARGESPPPPSVFSQQLAGITRAHVASADFENAAALNTSGEIIGDTDVPPFKRPRPDDTAEISPSVP